MAKPYSMDLRERVVAAVEEGGLSRRQAAARFGVGESSAIRWVGRYRETGSVAPGQMGGHKPKAIKGELAERGLKVDYHTMWDFVRGEQLSFKKSHWSPASASAPTSRAGAGNG